MCKKTKNVKKEEIWGNIKDTVRGQKTVGNVGKTY